MSRPLHVLYICNEYPPKAAGGIGPAVRQLAQGIARAGHQATVLGVASTPDERDDGPVRVIEKSPPRVPKLNWLLSRLSLRAGIMAVHRRHPVDVVEWPDFEGLPLWGLGGIPSVLKVHGTHLSHWKHGLAENAPLMHTFERRALRTIPNWIGVSRWFNEEWKHELNCAPERETVVYNPVDMSVFKPLDDGAASTRDVVYVGGLKRRKGVVGLLEAARIFLGRAPDARLVMMGAEADLKLEDVRRLAGEHADRVVNIPYQPQSVVAGLLARAAVFAMPSVYESCGNGWIEAMSCGVPVIGSKLSCGPEIVEDGVSGYTTDPGDAREIAARIETLLGDVNLAAEMGRRGRERVSGKFSLEVGVAESVRFYEECIRAAGGGR